MDTFSIKSSSSNEQFVFSERDGEFFQFEVVGEAIRASRKVSTYTDEFGVAKLFSKVDELGTPWHGVESWESLQRRFCD